MDRSSDRGQPGTLRPESWRESFVVKMMPEQDSGLAPIVGLDYRTWPDSLPAKLTDWLRRSSTEGQYLTAALGSFQKVRPILHHPGTWLQVQGMVVRRAHRIPGSVSKLQLDMVVSVALLVQDGGRQTPETVAGHAPFVAHAL